MKILLIPATGRNGFRNYCHVSNCFRLFLLLSSYFSLLAQMQGDSFV